MEALPGIWRDTFCRFVSWHDQLGGSHCAGSSNEQQGKEEVRCMEDGSRADSAFCDGREFGEAVHRGDR